MAYLWSDKIVDYYYSNPELDTVAVLWKDPDDGLTREHYIKVDESDEQWRDFVAEVSYDDINSRTEERHEHFREEFREAFRLWTDRPENNMTAEYTPVNESIHDFILNYDPKDVKQKEEMFKLKLKIFDQEIVKNSKLADKFKNANYNHAMAVSASLDLKESVKYCLRTSLLFIAQSTKSHFQKEYALFLRN